MISYDDTTDALIPARPTMVTPLRSPRGLGDAAFVDEKCEVLMTKTELITMPLELQSFVETKKQRKGGEKIARTLVEQWASLGDQRVAIIVSAPSAASPNPSAAAAEREPRAQRHMMDNRGARVFDMDVPILEQTWSRNSWQQCVTQLEQQLLLETSRPEISTPHIYRSRYAVDTIAGDPNIYKSRVTVVLASAAASARPSSARACWRRWSRSWRSACRRSGAKRTRTTACSRAR